MSTGCFLVSGHAKPELRVGSRIPLFYLLSAQGKQMQAEDPKFKLDTDKRNFMGTACRCCKFQKNTWHVDVGSAEAPAVPWMMHKLDVPLVPGSQ